MDKPCFKRISQLRESTQLNRLENPPTGIPRYNIAGEGYYSVTQILDDGKYAKIESKALLHAQLLGSVVHLQIENFFKKHDLLFNLEETLEENQLKLFKFLPDPSEEDWQTYLQSPSDPNNTVEEIVLKRRISSAYDHFTQFMQDHEVELLWSEEIVWNPEFLYAGTVDLLCYFDGKLAIIDHKTSRFIDETQESLDHYTGQLSAYARAIRTLEQEDQDIELNLLHLDPLGSKYKLVPRKYNFNVFLDSHVRFSQTKFTSEGIINDEMDEEIKNKLEKDFVNRNFTCPDKNCKKISTFPFPKQKEFLLENKVKKIVKIAYHEENDHYAIYHITIPDLTKEKSFIYNRNIE